GPHDPLDGRAQREPRGREDDGGDQRPDPGLLAEDLARRGEGPDDGPRPTQDRRRYGHHVRGSEGQDRGISGISPLPTDPPIGRTEPVPGRASSYESAEDRAARNRLPL